MPEDLISIIVDNQKLQLISRHALSTSATAAGHGQEHGEFGVVDRVTISDTARQHYRRYEDALRDQRSRARSVPGGPEAAIVRLSPVNQKPR
jgi:hypothetical protein